MVRVEERALKIEWAQDSAFRFYPVQEDERFGYRLHDADAAVNKVLALAGRSEIRDFVDVLHLDDSHLPLGALAWAACGKDPGFTPEFLLDHAARHVAYTQVDLDRLSLREPLDLTVLKRRWLAALERARALVAGLPPDEVGCLYVDADRRPSAPDPASGSFRALIRHAGLRPRRLAHGLALPASVTPRKRLAGSAFRPIPRAPGACAAELAGVAFCGADSRHRRPATGPMEWRSAGAGIASLRSRTRHNDSRIRITCNGGPGAQS